MIPIQKNYETIQNTIKQCCVQFDRQPDTVELVAVSKRKGVDLIQQAYDCGQKIFGENYLQEAVEKIPQLPADIRWHFIGHLQSNKAKLAVEYFDVIETVDRLKLARRLDKYAAELGKKPQILIQVNIGNEAQKAGVHPEDAERLIGEINTQTDLDVAGLMIIPPYLPDPESSRSYFSSTKKLAKELAQKQLFIDNDNIALSMGMSGDFHIAIEEGATLIRVGTALFGARN